MTGDSGPDAPLSVLLDPARQPSTCLAGCGQPVSGHRYCPRCRVTLQREPRWRESVVGWRFGLVDPRGQIRAAMTPRLPVADPVYRARCWLNPRHIAPTSGCSCGTYVTEEPYFLTAQVRRVVGLQSRAREALTYAPATRQRFADAVGLGAADELQLYASAPLVLYRVRATTATDAGSMRHFTCFHAGDDVWRANTAQVIGPAYHTPAEARTLDRLRSRYRVAVLPWEPAPG